MDTLVYPVNVINKISLKCICINFSSIAELKCKQNCNSHGVCKLGECICETGYSGEDCSIKGKF